MTAFEGKITRFFFNVKYKNNGQWSIRWERVAILLELLLKTKRVLEFLIFTYWQTFCCCHLRQQKTKFVKEILKKIKIN